MSELYDAFLRLDGDTEDWTYVRDSIKRLESNFYDFDDYQTFTCSTAVYPRSTLSESLAYLALGLSGEAGEVAGKVKKLLRGDAAPDFTEAVTAELGDVLWYLARLADELGVPLSVVAEKNKAKLTSRKTRGVLKGSGDDR